MKPIYHVNKEKKTVVCRLVDCSDVAMDKLVKRGYHPIEVSDVVIQDEFVGKAVCSATDEFDEEFGKVLAYQRACIKMNAAAISTMKTFAANVESFYTSFMNDIKAVTRKLEDGSAARKNSVNKLLHPEDGDKTEE